MELSLSVVLPVRNAETTLASRVKELLEILPEIAPRFEVLIVDDASVDQTEEIADQLTRQYPQLLYARHRRQRGAEAATQTGMMQTCGKVVIVQEETAEISISRIRRLWEMRHDEDLVMARTEAPSRTLSHDLLERLGSWAEELRESTASAGHSGVQMIRRRAVEQLDSPDGLKRPVHLYKTPAGQHR